MLNTTNNIKTTFKYRYLTKSEQQDIIDNNKLKNGPKCIMCHDNTDVIWRWRAVDQTTGEEWTVCRDCLDQHTVLDYNFDAYEIDWTKRINLSKIKLKYCKVCNGLFPTAGKDEYCCNDCNPSYKVDDDNGSNLEYNY